MQKIKTWIKIGDLFIDESNIRGASRVGSKTLIKLVAGDDLLVNLNYDKLRPLIPIAN